MSGGPSCEKEMTQRRDARIRLMEAAGIEATGNKFEIRKVPKQPDTADKPPHLGKRQHEEATSNQSPLRRDEQQQQQQLYAQLLQFAQPPPQQQSQLPPYRPQRTFKPTRGRGHGGWPYPQQQPSQYHVPLHGAQHVGGASWERHRANWNPSFSGQERSMHSSAERTPAPTNQRSSNLSKPKEKRIKVDESVCARVTKKDAQLTAAAFLEKEQRVFYQAWSSLVPYHSFPRRRFLLHMLLDDWQERVHAAAMRLLGDAEAQLVQNQQQLLCRMWLDKAELRYYNNQLSDQPPQP